MYGHELDAKQEWMDSTFSATMYTAFCILPSGMTGKTDASATLSLDTPKTLSRPSTAPSSIVLPMRQLPHGSGKQII